MKVMEVFFNHIINYFLQKFLIFKRLHNKNCTRLSFKKKYSHRLVIINEGVSKNRESRKIF